MTTRLGLLTLAGLALPAFAGPLDPPAGPIAPVMKPLTAVEPRATINSTNTPGDADSFYRVAAPGSYVLGTSVTIRSAQSMIEIATSNVVLDLNGLRIAGSGGTLSGVTLAPGVHNVTVRNGTIAGFDQHGISGASSANVTVENVSVSGVSLDGVALGPDANVHDVTVVNSGRDGIVTGAGSTVRDCVVSTSGAAGFNSTGSTSYEHCSSSDNARYGFALASGSAATDCTASGNLYYGVYVAGGSTGSTVEGCTVSAPNVSTANGIVLLGRDPTRFLACAVGFTPCGFESRPTY